MDAEQAIALAAAIARRFEGFYPRPYLCPAGIPTIGFGATRYENGRRVTLADPAIARERAEQLMQWELRRILPEVMRLCPGIDSSSRLAVILDFTFNLGAGRLQASTLRRRINAGQWDQVPTELRKWTKGGGKKLNGLIARREAEISLI